MPSPIAASAVPASGKAAAAAKAKPTMSFRSIHFLLFRDAGRRLFVLSDVQSPDPEDGWRGDVNRAPANFKVTDIPERKGSAVL